MQQRARIELALATFVLDAQHLADRDPREPETERLMHPHAWRCLLALVEAGLTRREAIDRIKAAWLEFIS